MQLKLSAPGVSITAEGDELLFRVKRETASPLLSILLHSKFSDGPRMEFLANPYVNALIEALIPAAGLSQEHLCADGINTTLAPTIQFVEEWAASNGIAGDQAKSLVASAIYPYRVKIESARHP